ncbi:MAG: hypothetical protein ABIF10_03565, partial [Candidatus Woesearchaeota archaeon]
FAKLIMEFNASIFSGSTCFIRGSPNLLTKQSPYNTFAYLKGKTQDFSYLKSKRCSPKPMKRKWVRSVGARLFIAKQPDLFFLNIYAQGDQLSYIF